MIIVVLLTRARSADYKGAKWTARMPPKRQVEGSNPSEPVFDNSIIIMPNFRIFKISGGQKDYKRIPTLTTVSPY